MLLVQRFINYLFAEKYLGGFYDDTPYTGRYAYADILEFKPPTDPADPLTGQWRLVANMTRNRADHAISVIDYSEVAHFCKED